MVDQNITYVVVNENALGYMWDTSIAGYRNFGVLASGIGGPNPKNGPLIITPQDTVRAATQEDFAAYRVCSDGHL